MSESISSQLNLLGFPDEISRHSKLLSLEKVNSFTDLYVNKLITKYGSSKIQHAIDSDSDPQILAARNQDCNWVAIASNNPVLAKCGGCIRH